MKSKLQEILPGQWFLYLDTSKDYPWWEPVVSCRADGGEEARAKISKMLADLMAAATVEQAGSST